MSRLHLPVHDASIFSWNGNTGVAEMSDLEAPGDAQVWDDSCDVGFILKSPKTGTEVLFTFVSEVKDAEGEVQAWIYQNTPVTSEVGLLKVHILND
jgi:hypothetical protein